MPERYHIERNTVQETLVIPLYARAVCSERYPELFEDEDAERICGMLDYDFESRKRRMESFLGRFGAIEIAQRQYDLAWEIGDYLGKHPNAAVVNLGCGLDDTFRRTDNGTCRGYNIDTEDIIGIRDKVIPAGDREENIACNLNDHSWMEHIDDSGGAVFYASGVFYYLMTDDIRRLISAMADHFPGAALVFDSCNRRGARMMTRTWLKEAGITDVDALFSLENPSAIKDWSGAI